MKGFYVYVHTCPNGKRYVGSTTKNPHFRWGKNGRCYEYNEPFFLDILKYGWDNIAHEVFEVDSREEMYRKEVELISFFHSNDPEQGYNRSLGGENSRVGCKMHHSEESRKKMSETRKGVPKPRYTYLFPDGTFKSMTPQNATKYYLKKGVLIVKVG